MLNKSYRLSMEARYYFQTENYKEAFVKAKEAYIADPYNRMAFSIYMQSKIAMQWVRFINDSDRYFNKIKQMADKPQLNSKEREKIKVMLEILLTEYKTLTPSLLLPETLRERAKIQYEKAKDIYEKVFAKRD